MSNLIKSNNGKAANPVFPAFGCNINDGGLLNNLYQDINHNVSMNAVFSDAMTTYTEPVVEITPANDFPSFKQEDVLDLSPRFARKN